jgi:hypothetical protein
MLWTPWTSLSIMTGLTADPAQSLSLLRVHKILRSYGASLSIMTRLTADPAQSLSLLHKILLCPLSLLMLPESLPSISGSAPFPLSPFLWTRTYVVAWLIAVGALARSRGRLWRLVIHLQPPSGSKACFLLFLFFWARTFVVAWLIAVGAFACSCRSGYVCFGF